MEARYGQEVRGLYGMKLIVTAIVNIVTFVAITSYMIGVGVNSTIAAIIGAAAVFGEIALIVRGSIGLG